MAGFCTSEIKYKWQTYRWYRKLNFRRKSGVRELEVSKCCGCNQSAGLGITLKMWKPYLTFNEAWVLTSVGPFWPLGSQCLLSAYNFYKRTEDSLKKLSFWKLIWKIPALRSWKGINSPCLHLENVFLKCQGSGKSAYALFIQETAQEVSLDRVTPLKDYH